MKTTTKASAARVERVQNLRRSAAASPIPSRKARRQGSRAAARRAATKEDQ